PILLDDDELSRLLKEATSRLASSGRELLRQSQPPSTIPSNESPIPSHTSATDLEEKPSYLQIANREVRSSSILLAGDLRQQQLRDTNATLEKLGNLNLREKRAQSWVQPSKEDEQKIDKLLNQLYSENPKERLTARDDLSALGTSAIKPLVKM